jgi:hypothetical protein
MRLYRQAEPCFDQIYALQKIKLVVGETVLWPKIQGRERGAENESTHQNCPLFLMLTPV